MLKQRAVLGEGLVEHLVEALGRGIPFGLDGEGARRAGQAITSDKYPIM